jgi:hypothetical protein
VDRYHIVDIRTELASLIRSRGLTVARDTHLAEEVIVTPFVTGERPIRHDELFFHDMVPFNACII